MGFAPIVAAIGTGLQIAGHVANARRERKQAKAERRAAKENAVLAEEDAVSSDINAREQMLANQQEGEEWGRSAAEEISALIAQRAASGSLMMGSNEGMVLGLRQLAARDQLRIRSEGLLRFRESVKQAENLRRQGKNYQREASAASGRARDAVVSGVLNVGSSLVGGARSIQTTRGQ